MIELRWIRKPNSSFVESHDKRPYVIIDHYPHVLQFRIQGVNSVGTGKRYKVTTPEWSEWRDIPAVSNLLSGI